MNFDEKRFLSNKYNNKNLEKLNIARKYLRNHKFTPLFTYTMYNYEEKSMYKLTNIYIYMYIYIY